MRALSLNFEREVPSARLGYALLAVGAVVMVLVIVAQALISQEMERHALAARPAQAKREAWVLPRGLTSEADAIAGARVVVGHLAGPGERVFVTLEAIDEPDVALLALTPDTRNRTLRILAEARGVEAMLSYLRVLEQSRAFTQVVLVEHEIQDSDPQRPLRFSLVAAWSP
ncbi:hypothetical protein [Ramlibacter sp. AN1133]|uniref:hypothetical protein n=1 Tax=Ramlibacter sp. AN1133 TaxID=3133429 RepID=UPI0030C5A969